MATTQNVQIGQSLVDFSLYGTFPEDEISSRHVAVGDLATALESLASAKSQLEVRRTLKVARYNIIDMPLNSIAVRDSQDQRRDGPGREPMADQCQVAGRRYQPIQDVGERDRTKVRGSGCIRPDIAGGGRKSQLSGTRGSL